MGDFGTPAGFLRTNLYDFFIPLLLAIAAVMLVSGQTAGEEASGRLELYLTQPISRRAVFTGRIAAALIALVVISVILLVVQLVSDAAVDLQMDSGYLVTTIVLSDLLGVFHGSLAAFVAAVRPRPSRFWASAWALRLPG